MRDFSRRTEKIAICRGEWEISRSVAENVKNRDLSRRIGNFAVSYMPRNPFVPVTHIWVYQGCGIFFHGGKNRESFKFCAVTIEISAKQSTNYQPRLQKRFKAD